MTRHCKKLIPKGEHACEVEVELIDSNEGWSPELPSRLAVTPGSRYSERAK